jgi:tetratricopeptide (TPR) repeat protein
MENVQARSLSQAEDFKRRYEALRVYINSEDPDAALRLEEIAALEEELAAFEGKGSGYAQAMAYGISAGIQGDRKNWEEAEKLWVSAAAAAGKSSYLSPTSLCNAAAAAENQGNNERAIELYTQALESGDGFPVAPRAQFALGRMHEVQGSEDAALESYRTLVANWPEDEVWAKLAQSRILALTSK